MVRYGPLVNAHSRAQPGALPLPSKPLKCTLNVDGPSRPVDVAPDTPTRWALRDHLGLLGRKFGCGSGRLREKTASDNTEYRRLAARRGTWTASGGGGGLNFGANHASEKRLRSAVRPLYELQSNASASAGRVVLKQSLW